MSQAVSLLLALAACASADPPPATAPPSATAVASQGLRTGPRTASPRSPVTITRVWLALGADGDVPGSGELRVTLGTPASLHVVIEGRSAPAPRGATRAERNAAKKPRVFASVDTVLNGRRTVSAEPWPESAGPVEITLFRLEADPVDGAIYDNTGSMEHAWLPLLRASHPERWHWCPIDYVLTETDWGSVWEHAIDGRGTTTADHGGLGTMRFVARVRYQGVDYWTPGLERKDAAGLLPGLPTIRVRRDDTDVGYMTELINVPYVFGSSAYGGTHQADRAVGADCADLIVYGWRRIGRDVEYTWTQGLKSLSRLVASIPSQEDGIYRDAAGRALRFGVDVQPGDLVLWRRHVGVIAGVDPTGYLSLKTPVLHTVVESPELETMGEVGFGFSAGDFEVRRPKWNEKPKRRRGVTPVRRG